jgi:hypothetical protein
MINKLKQGTEEKERLEILNALHGLIQCSLDPISFIFFVLST